MTTENKNPFNKRLLTASYCDMVLEQVRDLDLSDAKVVDLIGKDVATFRMSLRHASKPLGLKFKTKTDVDGNLWVMRFK